MNNFSPAEDIPGSELDELRRRVAVLEVAQSALDVAQRQRGELLERLRLEVAHRQSTEEANRYSTAIETLLASISTRFVNVSAEKFEPLVKRSLEETGRFLGVDRAYLFLFSDDGRRFSSVAEWCAPGVRAESESLQEIPVEQLPWISGRLRRAELVSFRRLSELPAEAAAERREFQREGIQSLLNVPVYHAGKVVGFVGFDSVCDERTWTNEEVRILRILAELLGGAVGRRRTEVALRDSEERFRRVFEEGPVGMILVNADRRYLQVNRAYVKMIGYDRDELVGQAIACAVHPDDVPLLEPMFCRVLSGQLKTFTVELRYSHRDEGIVWGRLTGTAIRDLDGRVMYGFGMVEDITDRKEAQQQADREQELLRRLLDLHERERKMISYEIHDGLAQQLTGALFTFQALAQICNKVSPEAQALLNSGLQTLGDGVAETRRLISGLRPPILDESGVVVAIEYLVADFEKRFGVSIDFVAEVQFHRLALPLENALFRMAQETLTNATRYSHSPRIEVRLEQVGCHIVFTVQDWGVGFNPDEVDDDHFGIRGVRERARLLGGTAEVYSAPNQGTRIHVELPLIEARDGDSRDLPAMHHTPR
jgi:PAS domain S-box-containing protein